MAPAEGVAALAMRQMSEEAAQKAKTLKKKTANVLSGAGEAVASATSIDTKNATASSSAPTNVDASATASIITEPATILQDPETSAWSEELKPTQQKLGKLESLQSPTSTAWKPTEINLPIRTAAPKTEENPEGEKEGQGKNEAK